MTGQPSESFTGILAALFFLYLGFMTWVGYRNPPERKRMSSSDWDMIAVGVIDDQPQPTPKVEAKPKPEPKPKTKPQDDKFYKECIDVLVAMKTPKRKAKAMADNVFSQSRPDTVQDFITLCFKK